MWQLLKMTCNSKGPILASFLCMKKTFLLSSCWILFIIFTLEIEGLFMLENARELHKSQKNGGAGAKRDSVIFSRLFLTFIFVA